MEFFADAFLTSQGIARRDVTMVNIQPEKMPDALANGYVDAVATPYLSKVQQKLGDKGIIFTGEDIYTQTFNLAAKQDYISKDPGKIRKMIRALLKAEEFVARYPVEAQKTVSAFRKTDLVSLSTAWESNTFRVTLDQSLLFVLEDESRWAIKRGLTGEAKIPDYLDYIYLDGLMSVKPKAVRIVR